jgi:hypothetical protein
MYIGHVHRLKRILTKAQHDTSGQTPEVTAVEFDIYRVVQNAVINARVRGQLMLSAHVHASTARSVVKDTLLVQAELKLPMLAPSRFGSFYSASSKTASFTTPPAVLACA